MRYLFTICCCFLLFSNSLFAKEVKIIKKAVSVNITSINPQNKSYIEKIASEFIEKQESLVIVNSSKQPNIKISISSAPMMEKREREPTEDNPSKFERIQLGIAVAYLVMKKKKNGNYQRVMFENTFLPNSSVPSSLKYRLSKILSVKQK